MIVLNDRKRIRDYVVSRLYRPPDGMFPDGTYEAIGFENSSGGLLGGVIYNNYTGHDIELSGAGEPGWLSPLNLHAIFAYPFMTLDLKRCSCSCAKGNKNARKFVQRLGFRMEGVRRAGHWSGQDEVHYGMLFLECKWLDDRWVEGYGKEFTEAA